MLGYSSPAALMAIVVPVLDTVLLLEGNLPSQQDHLVPEQLSCRASWTEYINPGLSFGLWLLNTLHCEVAVSFAPALMP